MDARHSLHNDPYSQSMYSISSFELRQPTMIPTHVFNSMILTDNPCTQLIPSNSIKPIEVTYCKNTLYNTCINQQYQIQQMLNKYQDIEQNLNGQISKDNTNMQNDINCFLHLRPHNQQIYLHQE